MESYLPYFLIFIGVGLIIFLTSLILRATKSKSWEKTSGVLLDKGTRLHISRDIITKNIDWKSIHIDVQYEYEVDGKIYISKRVTFSDMVNKPMSCLNKLLNEYLSTNKIIVYYNPKNHGDSVLFPGATIWNFTPMITGVIFISVGIFLLNS